MSIEKSDKLTEINTLITENSNNYYSDVFTPGETKEQLKIGAEIAKEPQTSGVIDTNTLTQTTDNIYTLSVDNPDGKIFSLGVDGKVNTFKIGFFGNTQLAYETLEEDLQDWLGDEYIVEYNSGTNFVFKRLDKQELTISHPDLVRELVINDWTEYTVLNLTIDGTLYVLDGATYSTVDDIYVYLDATLGSEYYTNEDNKLIIARADASVPVITATSDDRYTYRMGYSYADTVNNAQYLETLTTTVGTESYVQYTNTESRAYKGHLFMKNLVGYDLETEIDISGATSSVVGWLGQRFVTQNKIKFTKATKPSFCTATKARITNSDQTIVYAEADFTGDIATFDLELESGTYWIQAGIDNSTFYNRVVLDISDDLYNNYIKVEDGINYNISAITTKLLLDEDTDYIISDTVWNSSNGPYTTYPDINEALMFGYTHYFTLIKSDYTQISPLSNVNHYTNPTSFPDDSSRTSIVESDNNATIAITTHTEISITLTLDSNNYFIPIKIKFSKIQINASSTVGNSEGVYQLRSQSCTVTSTAEVVNDKIFKTDSNNYGNIVLIKKGGFVLQLTTNTSNKLNYICS